MRIEAVSIEDTVSKYTQSAINLNSLQSQHKNKELEKQKLVVALAAVRRMHGLLLVQSKEVGGMSTSELSIEELQAALRGIAQRIQRVQLDFSIDSEFLQMFNDAFFQIAKLTAFKVHDILNAQRPHFECSAEILDIVARFRAEALIAHKQAQRRGHGIKKSKTLATRARAMSEDESEGASPSRVIESDLAGV